MKKLIALIALCWFVVPSYAQMVLDHHYAKPLETQCQPVFLSRSGKKIMTMNGDQHGPDTIFFYNMDYSLWKQIVVPARPNYGIALKFRDRWDNYGGVLYPSETLFNSDTLLELAVYYKGVADNKLLIINENGTVTDSIVGILNVDEIRVYEGAGGVFYATASTMSGVDIFKLPGTLPCENCCGKDTVVIRDTVISTSHYRRKSGIQTQTIPNPSKDEVKIAFTLPDGTDRGELKLYNNIGQLVKSCQVDNRFGFITLDNSLLPPGVYYYNIIVNGQVSSTQKLLVVK